MNYLGSKTELEEKGYSILSNLYTDFEVIDILNCINSVKKSNNSFIETKDLFAIRQLVKNVPKLKEYLFNKKLLTLMPELFSANYFLTKAIYFDKPNKSNWFVGYHQDLSISVDQKTDSKIYVNWVDRKEGVYGVQPPIHILEDSITVRIHLDDTDKNNGALRVIPKSHKKGILRLDSTKIDQNIEQVCEVKRGGIMLMKPLLLHASNRTTNGKQRRVIHLEFSKHKLASPLKWFEYSEVSLQK